jgi:hypothetical protein
MLNKNNGSENGFVTMIILMLIILGVVVFLAYKNVINN